MPRPHRYWAEGVPQHVIQRGVNRQPVFFSQDDYRDYLGFLRRAAARHGCALHAYVLMPNHVHLLVTGARAASTSKLMQSVGRCYVTRVNRYQGRNGSLWEGRYKASLVDAENYLLACYRYIELNPVRAGLAARPEQYPWSSYRAHALGADNDLIRDHPHYLALGAQPDRRQSAYRALAKAKVGDQELQSIRSALNQCLALGSEAFKDQMEGLLGERMRPGQPGRPRKAAQA